VLTKNSQQVFLVSIEDFSARSLPGRIGRRRMMTGQFSVNAHGLGIAHGRIPLPAIVPVRRIGDT
jgi:hypothetical protein